MNKNIIISLLAITLILVSAIGYTEMRSKTNEIERFQKEIEYLSQERKDLKRENAHFRDMIWSFNNNQITKYD